MKIVRDNMDFNTNVEQNNEFPPYDRKRIRRAAKNKAFSVLKEHRGLVFLTTLVALLPSILVDAIIALIEWQSMKETLASLGSLQQNTLMTTTSFGGSGSIILLDLLIVFALIPLNIGLYHVFTVLLRGKEVPSVNLIFSRFQSGKRYGLSVKLSILLAIYSVFWKIIVATICIAPFMVVIRHSGLLGNAGSLVLILLGYILMFFMVLFYKAKISTYESSFLLSLDYEENRARELFFGARVLFSGHLFELMVFFLSFIGWYLAPTVVIAGLGSLAYLSGVGTSATLPLAMAILIAVVVIILIVYCLFIQAYQSMAFVSLTEELRARSGDASAISLDRQTVRKTDESNE